MQTLSDREIRKTWWGPVWRGLVVDPQARHRQKMRGALWLYLYLLIHADRTTGKLTRRYYTIAEDMGVPPRTVRQWMTTLRQQDYISSRPTGRALVIHIQKWKPITAASRGAKK